MEEGCWKCFLVFALNWRGKKRECAAKERANIAAAFWLSVVDDCDGCLVMGTEAMVKAQCLVDTFFFFPPCYLVELPGPTFPGLDCIPLVCHMVISNSLISIFFQQSWYLLGKMT